MNFVTCIIQNAHQGALNGSIAPSKWFTLRFLGALINFW